MRAGKVIGGIVLIILGIFVYIGSSIVNTASIQRVEECNSIIGQLGQALDQQTVEACNNALAGQSISYLFMAIGLLMAVIGIALVIIGSLQESKQKKESKAEPITISPEVNSSGSVEKIFCRYCGKQRTILAEFCPICGRSSQTSSTAMKRCYNCSSSMSEDSEFCANCGQKFGEKKKSDEEIKRYYYTSDGKKKEKPSV